MTDPKPYQVARWISDDLQYTDFTSLREVVEETLRVHLTGRSEDQIADLSEAITPAVHHQLGIVADELRQDGIDSPFSLDGDPTTAYIKAQHNEAVLVLARIRALNPTEFEVFCTDLLGALGGIAYHVGGTGDGGVDFIATDLPISHGAGAALSKCANIVIGQAKRYQEDNLVGIGDLRSFLGAALIKADELKRKNERFGLFSPVSFAFWTTSNFNSNAKDFAARSGIWHLGGLALAQLSCRVNLAITQGI